MICQKCGAENKDGASFCENCGTSLSNHSETRLIKLHCKNCGGDLMIDPEASQITCPYCGEKQVLIDSDKVKIEKEKYKTIKEMQKIQYQEEQAKQDRLEKKDELLEYKKSKQSKFTLAAAVISFIIAMSNFASSSIFKGIGCLILFGLFLYSYLCGMQIVKEKIKNTKNLGVLAACLLLVVFSFTGCLSRDNSTSKKSSSSSKSFEKLEWPSNELTSLLPKPSFKYGTIESSSDSYLWVTFNKASAKEYKDYVEKCKNKGFTYDSNEYDTGYSAYTSDGYSLSLYYDETDSEITLDLSTPEKYAEFSWPSSSLASLIPEAKSNLGYVFTNTEEEVIITVGNTTLEELSDYIDACIEMGFNVDYYKTDDYFEGNDANGNNLIICKDGFEAMYIDITRSKESTKETPVPTQEVSVTEEPVATEESSSDNSVVTPSFKELMDSYEAFFDEYIAFMQKYESSTDTTSMLLDYTNLVTKEIEWIDKIDAIDESELSVADDLYYLEVTARVEKKLYDASLN